MSKIVAIIPARYASVRFPAKVLTNINGKPMLKWVYDGVRDCDLIDEVIVATDHQLVFDAMSSLGVNVKMTSEHHLSGTDRCAEVAESIQADIIINVQGDEPLITAEPLEQLVHSFYKNEDQQIATLIRKMDSKEAIQEPNVVKVVKDKRAKALYFSRSVIPFPRAEKEEVTYFQHIGIYAFKRSTLLEISKLDPSTLEKAEKLEQLRWMEAGYEIYTVETDHVSIGVDVPSDIKKVASLLQKATVKTKRK